MTLKNGLAASAMLFLVVCSTSAVPRGAATFVNPRLKEMSVKSVLMLPPIVEMTQNGVKGKQAMGKEADEANVKMSDGVSGALRACCGFAVDSPFTEAALQGNDELKYAVADVQRRFDDIATQVYKKHKDIRKGRFSLGDSVAALNAKGTADVLVIVRSSGQKETKGKGYLTGGLVGLAMSGTPTFQSRVALVDAKNGDILFLAEYFSSGLPKDKTYEKSLENITKGK